MQRIKYSILTAVLATVFTACTTDIDINLDDSQPELVVEGTVTTDTLAHTIQLTKTANYFSNVSAEAVSGAVVTLSDGLTTITLPEDKLKKGAYRTPATYFGVAGRTYTLTIGNVDVNSDGVQEQYTASCPLKRMLPMDSIAVKKNQLFGQEMWAVKVWVQDPPKELNYYLVRGYRNGLCISDSINEWGITNDQFFDGKYLQDETFLYFSSTKEDEQLKSGDVIGLELCGITEDYLNYIQETQNEFWPKNPLFGGQPANIRTNIKQLSPKTTSTSPRGYFAAYSVSWAKTVYKE